MKDRSNQPEFIGLWYRVGALLWDVVIVLALTAGSVAALVGDQFNSEHGQQMSALLLALIATAYTLGWWILAARTPGQWLCSSRIVDFRSGGKPKVWQCLLRYLVAPLSMAPLAIGFLWAARQRQRRTWHDLLARTAVIGDSSLRSPSAEERAEVNYCIQEPPWRAG